MHTHHCCFCFLILLLLFPSRFEKVPVLKPSRKREGHLETHARIRSWHHYTVNKNTVRRVRNHCLHVLSKSQKKHSFHKFWSNISQYFDQIFAVGKESSKNSSNLCFCIKDHVPIKTWYNEADGVRVLVLHAGSMADVLSILLASFLQYRIKSETITQYMYFHFLRNRKS